MPSLTELPFTLADAICTLVGLCLLAGTILPAGLLLTAYLEPQKFNQKNKLELFLHALMLSICFCPVIFYLTWKIHFLAVAFFVVATWIIFILRLNSLFPKKIEKEKNKTSASSILKFLIFFLPTIFFFIIVDWQWGERLYMSVVCYDYEKHVAVTNAISQANSLPPINPMYFFESGQALFYYYFWFLLPAFVSKITLGFVGPYPAVIAGTMLTSLAFLGLMNNMQEEFFKQGKHQLPLALLLVSGLDLLIVLPLNLFSLNKYGFQPFTSVEAWSMDQVSNFMHMLIWVPHHVTGAIAALTAVIFAFKGFSNIESDTRTNNKYLLAAAVCFASSFGLSVYLAFVTISSLCVYVLLNSLKTKLFRQFIELAAVLALTGIIALPFVIELQSHHSNLKPIAFAVRTSGLLRYFLDPNEKSINTSVKDQLGLNQPTTAYPLESLFLLIFDYPMEFGFFLVGAILYWFNRIKSKQIEDTDLLPFCLFSTSIIICTFLRSAIHNNDLGWRGLIPAQIILLFWSASYIGKNLSKPKSLILLIVLALVGLGTTLYEFYLLRFSLLDKKREMLECKPERNYWVRKAYEQMRNEFQVSIIQANPRHDRDPYFGLYSNHQTLCSDKEYGPLFGIEINQYNKYESAVQALFSGNYNYEETKALAMKWKIDALFVKDDDPIFLNNWNIKPDLENKFVKVYLFKRN
jgi:hypothetical protein